MRETLALADDANHGFPVVYGGTRRFETLSPPQRRHAKTYVIAREVLPANSNRAVNKFLIEYEWNEQQLNHERLEELQKHGKTRWS